MKNAQISFRGVTHDNKIKNGTDLMTCKMTFANLRPEQRANAIKNTVRVGHTHSRTGNKLAAMRKAGKAPELACKSSNNSE